MASSGASASNDDACGFELAEAGPIFNIADNYGGTTWPIVGTASSQKIDDLIATTDVSTFQGRNAGRNDCQILENNNDGVLNDIVKNHDSDQGDSGGVVFWLNSNDEALIINNHIAGLDEDGDTGLADAVGEAMYDQESFFGISV